jgi:hypothetical protein
MKSTFFTIILGALSIHCALTQTIQDPIRDYLTSHDADRDTAMPGFQNLFVVKCDITNSGKQSILLSLNDYGGRQGNYWTAYLPTSGGYVKADDSETTLIFIKDMFYVGSVGGKYGLLAYAPGGNGGDLNLFQIINGKVAEQKVGTLSLSKPEDKKTLEGYFGEAPDWKSLKRYSVKTLNLGDLRQKGYDVDQAIQAAKAGNHPLYKPLTR